MNKKNHRGGEPADGLEQQSEVIPVSNADAAVVAAVASAVEIKTAEEKIPKALRFSDWWDKNSNCVSTPTEFSLIDHILITPFLNNKIKKAYIYQEYPEFCGTYNSDHYPMIIELESNI
jgi:exonuclease III